MKNLRLTISFFFFVFIFLSSPSKIFAIDLTFSSPPSEITSNQEFTVDVTLNTSTNSEYYIRGIFYKKATSKFFGYTKNNDGEWNNSPSNYENFYKISAHSTQPITFKPDTESSYFTGSGEYVFQLYKYTINGSTEKSDQTATITIAESVTPTSSPTTPPNVPTNITLSEIYACPESGGNEWVEIYNNNDQEVTLTDWKIRDKSEKSFSFSLSIPPQFQSVIELNNSIKLNNDQETVELINPLNETIDEMSYSSCKPERSWIKHEGSWKDTLTITKGSTNSYSAPATDAPDPTNTPKPSATPKPTATEKPSATTKPTSTPKTTSTQQSLDDNGELILDSTLSALESSPSGLVLGTETDESINLPSEKKDEEEPTTQQSDPKTAAIASLIVGGLLLTGIGGFALWQWYQKSKE